MTGHPARTVQNTWFAMVALTTIGEIDSERKLPAPRQYVAISVVWSILSLLTDTQLARFAARFSILVLLTATVLGPFGKRAVQFLNLIAQRFAISPTTGAGVSAGAPSGTFTPAPLGPARNAPPSVTV